MSVRPILRLGNPILQRVAVPVEDPTAPAIAALIADMQDTLAESGGVGLAAPQIGVSLRVVIFKVPEVRAADGIAVPLTVLINPRLESLGDAREEAWEACLSLPGLMGRVPRWARLRYAGVDAAGVAFTREAAGFHARVVQHECDHLDGVLYPARLADPLAFGYVEEVRAALADD